MYAKNIWVRGGGLYAGDATTVYTQKVNIWLEGGYNSDYFVIDSRLDAGNKVLFVTGELILNGVVPSSVHSYLVATAAAGTQTLNVANAAGWKVGDSIVLSASGNNPSSYETLTIASIT